MSKNILIIDDEEIICKMLTIFLEDYGFNVKTAASGNEAINIISRENFDIALVDMQLKDMNGEEIINKSHFISPKTKFIVHTGSLDYEIPKSLIEIGLNEDSILYKSQGDMNTIYNKINESIKEKS